MTKIGYLFVSLFALTVLFLILGWQVDGFDFFKAQDYEFYFQSWISLAGSIFALIMSATIFIIYKKSDKKSLKYISVSFLIISLAYALVGYHTSYCKVCSDLSLCGVSHNYPDYFILMSMIVFVVILLIFNKKFNLSLFKTFFYGMLLAVSSLMGILFLSIKYIEIPNVIPYVFHSLNLQGFIFILPLIFTGVVYLYFRKTYRITAKISLLFFIIALSFIPQAYHIFSCFECNRMECSEFFSLSGLLMFIAIGLIFYSLDIALKNEMKKNDPSQ